MGRLAPKLESAGPPAITVKKDAGMEIKSSETRPGQIDWLKWSEERDRRIKEYEEQLKRDRKAAADAKAENLRLWKEDYPAWYAQETSTNGCSIPTDFGKSLWANNTEECNEHDVAYGRGGVGRRIIADAKLAYAIWKKSGLLKAKVTWDGLRVGGWANYSWFNPDGSIRWAPAPTPAEKAAADQAEADQKAAADAAHQATLARSNEIIAGVALIPASPRGGENAFARQALSDAGITDRAEQDQALQDYFNRDKTDMK